jgi:FAD/FMN-containing dehydrogenase
VGVKADLRSSAGPAVDEFAAEVGGPDAGPVVAVGGRTQWDVGGPVDPSAREVQAPAGIVAFDPAEMTVRVRAGTRVDELDATLGERNQFVALPGGGGATVGGVLAVGRSGPRRLGYGPVRDAVLGITWVGANGRVVKAGGATVKNVSGYDMCRLFVGSLGTLGLLAEVVLRTRPVPATEQWFSGAADPFALAQRLHHPTAVLWDGATTWLLLEGHRDDVAAEAAKAGLEPAAGPPAIPPHRWSHRPSDLARSEVAAHGPFVAEVGVGLVHRHQPAPPVTVSPAVARLDRRIKALFDPTGRLAPGRDIMAGTTS